MALSSLAELQQEIASFAARYNLQTEIEVRLLDLASEVGELCKAHLEATAYGQHPFHNDASWEEEMGDLIFALLLLAEGSHIDLEKALRQALAKYQRRAQARGEIGSGRSRTLPSSVSKEAFRGEDHAA